MPALNRKQNVALWSEPPLPGMAECLTVQLNATYYRSGNSCRWVAVLRDPLANEELLRLIGITQPDTQGAVDTMFHDLAQLLAMVDYQLYGTVDDLKQALSEEPPPPAELPAAKRRSRSKVATS